MEIAMGSIRCKLLVKKVYLKLKSIRKHQQ